MYFLVSLLYSWIVDDLLRTFCVTWERRLLVTRIITIRLALQIKRAEPSFLGRNSSIQLLITYLVFCKASKWAWYSVPTIHAEKQVFMQLCQMFKEESNNAIFPYFQFFQDKHSRKGVPAKAGSPLTIEPIQPPLASVVRWKYQNPRNFILHQCRRVSLSEEMGGEQNLEKTRYIVRPDKRPHKTAPRVEST